MKINRSLVFRSVFAFCVCAALASCPSVNYPFTNLTYTPPGAPPAGAPATTRILYLHHSTGGVIWGGGVDTLFADYNAKYSTSYTITQRAYPKDAPYGWANYPYDYWNIWVNHSGNALYEDEETLEMMTPNYDVIVFKHCYPVSGIEADISGGADVSSPIRSLQNYKLQYNALKTKLHTFPATKFIVWTGAALLSTSADSGELARSREFFSWVKNEWDEPGDNIFVWDFYELETEGHNYLNPEYSGGDDHPSSAFAEKIAPMFVKRAINVLQGNGDTTNIWGF